MRFENKEIKLITIAVILLQIMFLTGNVAVVIANESPIIIQDVNDKIRVACIGDSITFGAGIAEPNGSYPSQLGQKLGQCYQVANFGVNNCTMLRNGDCPYWSQPVLNDVVTFNPHVVVIALGTNDCKPQNWQHKKLFVSDCIAMIRKFSQGNTKVFICFPPPVYGEISGITESVIYNELITMIAQAARLTSTPIIDLHTALINQERLFQDMVHPNYEGASIIANVVCDAVHKVTIKVTPFPGTRTDWYGYSKYDFSDEDIQYAVVVPKRDVFGRQWIWRAEFFGHEPQADLALLEKGWYVVYVPSAAGLYGSPEAVRRWDVAYKYLTRNYSLSKKPTLEGFSRGGLLVYNWAAENQEKVACIYADAPVCAIQSWPGGLGKGKGSSQDWKQCLEAYGLSEQEALDYKRNPIDKLRSLADSNVPLLHICGDIDDVVPMEENTNIIKQRYTELGGHIEVITKPNCGHHPHSLKDPRQIVDFIVENSD